MSEDEPPVVFALGLAVFPTIPLGSGRVTDLQELVALKLLPATPAASAAACHVVALHRERLSSARASTPD